MVRVWLVLAVAVVGCGGDDEAVVLVDVQTTLVPGVDFVTVRTEVDGSAVTRAAVTGEDYVGGARVAEVGVSPGAHDIAVELRDATGAAVSAGGRRVEIRGRRIVTFVLGFGCVEGCPDGGVDAGSPPDAGPADAGAPDSGSLDAGPLDAGCDPADGCCTDTDCDDGIFCTVDLCMERMCRGFEMADCCDRNEDCNDFDRCTDDSCDLGTHSCASTAIPDCCEFDADCFDANDCTADSCAGSRCSFAPISCDDLNPCTDDSCSPAIGCAFTNNTLPCDDGRFCTVADTCAGGACGGTPRSCDDARPCTTDSCAEATDVCANAIVSGCLIGGECFPEGAVNPTSACQQCRGAASRTSWTEVAPGTCCGTASYGGCSGRCVRQCAPGGGCVDALPTCASWTGCAPSDMCITGTCTTRSTCMSGRCCNGTCC